MTLYGGDLTMQSRVATWLASPPALPSTILGQLITSMTSLIYGKLSRARIYSQTFTRSFDVVGTMQLVLPDYPVTSVTSLQIGNCLVPAYPLPTPPGTATTTVGYGYRIVPWAGDLPGQESVIELVNGFFYTGAQNVKCVYQAGYLISNEAQTVPATAPYTMTVTQPQGIWSRDNGVYYAASGVKLTPVASSPTTGQYIPPQDNGTTVNYGQYTFSVGDAGANLLINYSFIPSDLEEACIQMVAERYSYRSRIGEMSKSLGGQENVRFMRGGNRGQMFPGIPPEVETLIMPYVSVVPPAIGAPT